MTDFRFKGGGTSTVKFSGLDGSLDLESDIHRPTYEEAWQRHVEAEEMKRKLMNKHFDPTHMDMDIPDPPDTGSVSFNADDMTFNF